MEAQLTLTVGDTNNKDVSLIGTKQEHLNSNESNSVVDKILKKSNEKRKRPKPMSTDSSKSKKQNTYETCHELLTFQKLSSKIF